MLKIGCDQCLAPIDPQKDSYFDVPQMTIAWKTKLGRMLNLHFCSKSCFCGWLSKNAEPSTIIASLNEQGPAL